MVLFLNFKIRKYVSYIQNTLFKPAIEERERLGRPEMSLVYNKSYLCGCELVTAFGKGEMIL